MSSSLDQRSAKSHEGHAVPGAQTKDVDYAGYMQGHPVQGSQMGQPAVADSYYYTPYMQFQGDGSASGWPTGRDAAAAAAMSYGYSPYAPMTTDYMTGRSMFGQYDYSSWFPGFEYGATSWGASLMPVQPATAPQKGSLRGDYVDPTGGATYYEVDSSNGVTGINGSSTGAGGSINAVEQGVKSLKVSADEDSVADHGGNSGGNSGSYARSAQSGSAPAKKSWANIASQPARPAGRSKIVPRAPVSLAKGDVGAGSTGGGSWENKTGPGQARSQGTSGSYSSVASSANAGSGGSSSRTSTGGTDTAAVPAGGSWTNAESSSSVPAIAHQYNPKEFDLNPKAARFFVIKSFSEDDIHRSIKYGIWCSTEYGNKRLDTAFREREGKGPIYLFFSVNGSGHFCGVAQMSSPVDYHKSAGVWAQDKWKGQFEVRWIYVKDVPNSQLRHIKLENNEGKPVTNSRDTQEVPPEKGKQVLRVIHQYRHTTSIFDDFQHYEKQQADTKKDHGNRSDD